MSNSNEILIRKAKIEDFPVVFQLLSKLWPNQVLDEAATRENYTERIVSSSTIYCCAESQGKIVGFCGCYVMNSFRKENRYAYLSSIIVEEEYRRKGIGKMLMDYAVSSAKAAGCLRMELDSGFHRVFAHQFYEKYGFERKGLKFEINL